MLTTNQCIKRINPLVLVQILVEISVQFQKILIVNIKNFAILAADILLIRYIGTSLSVTVTDSSLHALIPDMSKFL